MVSDPISDMLTRIRNANALRYETVSMPSSKMKIEIVKILQVEGYITSYDEKVVSKGKKELTIILKFGPRGERVITGLKRISKPGFRVTVAGDKVPTVLGGLGTAILSTSKGVITDKEARRLKVGGEILAYIW